MHESNAPFEDPDWWTQNESDGQEFYGYDEEETGRTTWYTEDGDLDCETLTPSYYDLSTEREIYEGLLEDLSGHEE